jgi:phosphoadenosine phosphosulfate reductase
MSLELPDLEGRDARDVLTWAFERFGDRVAISTAFGPSGIVVMHLAHALHPAVRAFFLDTGFHFPETLAMVDRVRDRLGIEIDVVRPDAAAVAAVEGVGGDAAEPLYARDTDACCGVRKVEPTRRVLAGLDAWITGLRRDQGPSRATTPVLEVKENDGRALVKVNPLVSWDRKAVWTYLFDHELPYNPLHDQGYPSVGCWPCTRPAAADGDERAGRWAGQGKTECGLHTRIR